MDEKQKLKVFGFVNPELKFDPGYYEIPNLTHDEEHRIDLAYFWLDGTPITYQFYINYGLLRARSSRPRVNSILLPNDLKDSRKISGADCYPEYFHYDHMRSTSGLIINNLFGGDGYFDALDDTGSKVSRKLVFVIGDIVSVKAMFEELAYNQELDLAA